MNKLCCEIRTHGECKACGIKWCEPCSEEYSWEPGVSSHSSYEPASKVALWTCPVAGLVKFGTVNWETGLNVETGWTFIPLNET